MTRRNAYAPRVITGRTSTAGWLFSRAAAVLAGAILAVAVLVGAGLLVLHLAFGPPEYYTHSVKSELTRLVNTVQPPIRSESRPAGRPNCDDSVDAAWVQRRFDVDDARGMTSLMGALRSQLEADGWLRRPTRHVEYVHDFGGKTYWADLDARAMRVRFVISAGGPF